MDNITGTVSRADLANLDDQIKVHPPNPLASGLANDVESWPSVVVFSDWYVSSVLSSPSRPNTTTTPP